MGFDPDFIINAAGQDVTKYVIQWKLRDTDDGISTLSVKLANPDQVLSNKIQTDEEATITFGYIGNMGEQVSMKIKEVNEAYSVEAEYAYVSFTAMDCMEKLTGGTEQAGGGEEPSSRPEKEEGASGESK